jgi:hypothetical protein
MAAGTLFHSIMEKYCVYNKIPETKEELVFLNEFESAKDFLSDQENIGFFPSRSEWVLGDINFVSSKHELGQIGLSGTLDLLLFNPTTKKCKIVDFKHKPPSTFFQLKDNKERDEYRIQLGMYCYLIQKTFGSKFQLDDKEPFIILKVHEDFENYIDKIVLSKKECFDCIAKNGIKLQM